MRLSKKISQAVTVFMCSMAFVLTVKSPGEIPHGTLLSVVRYKGGSLVAEDRSIQSTTSNLSQKQSKVFTVGKNVMFAVTNAQGIAKEDGTKIISLREDIENYCHEHELEFAEGRLSQQRIDDLALFVEARFKWGLGQIANSQKVLELNDATLFSIFVFYRDCANTTFKMTRIILKTRPTWRLAKDPELRMQDIPYFLAGDLLVTENILTAGGIQRAKLDFLIANHSTIDFNFARKLLVDIMQHAHSISPSTISKEFDLYSLSCEKGIDKVEH